MTIYRCLQCTIILTWITFLSMESLLTNKYQRLFYTILTWIRHDKRINLERVSQLRTSSLNVRLRVSQSEHL